MLLQSGTSSKRLIVVFTGWNCPMLHYHCQLKLGCESNHWHFEFLLQMDLLEQLLTPKVWTPFFSKNRKPGLKFSTKVPSWIAITYFNVSIVLDHGVNAVLESLIRAFFLSPVCFSETKSAAENLLTRLLSAASLPSKDKDPLTLVRILVFCWRGKDPCEFPPITYYWTVPLILDHWYLVGKSTSSKIADAKVSEF